MNISNSWESDTIFQHNQRFQKFSGFDGLDYFSDIADILFCGKFDF